MEGHGLSHRRACRLAGIGHSTLRYQRRRANDEAVRKRLRELAAQRRRFGYRRLGWLLAREGRAHLAQACFDFLPTRAELDLGGWEELDIFAH